jgi:hypothetical protein
LREAPDLSDRSRGAGVSTAVATETADWRRRYKPEIPALWGRRQSAVGTAGG